MLNLNADFIFVFFRNLSLTYEGTMRYIWLTNWRNFIFNFKLRKNIYDSAEILSDFHFQTQHPRSIG